MFYIDKPRLGTTEAILGFKVRTYQGTKINAKENVFLKLNGEN